MYRGVRYGVLLLVVLFIFNIPVYAGGTSKRADVAPRRELDIDTEEHTGSNTIVLEPVENSDIADLNIDTTTGYIFIGESHVHKLEEALTEDIIFLEAEYPTYFTDYITSDVTGMSYKYDFGEHGNGSEGQIFCIHALHNTIGGISYEPEYRTRVTGVEHAMPEWLFEGNGVKNNLCSYNDTATAYERVMGLVKDNPEISKWNVIVMQGYFTTQQSDDFQQKFITNMNLFKKALESTGINVYISTVPHSNVGMWYQESVWTLVTKSIVNNKQGEDTNFNNTKVDIFNQKILAAFPENTIICTKDGTSVSSSDRRGTSGSAYEYYDDSTKPVTAFSFDDYAHLDKNHYDSSTMYAWAKYLINIIDSGLLKNDSEIQQLGKEPALYSKPKTAKYNFKEDTITLDLGLNKNYKIAWISDLHIVANYGALDDVTRGHLGYSAEDYIKLRYEMFKTDDNSKYSVDLWSDVIDYINSGSFDAVIFGGDLIDHYTKRNYDVLRDGLNKIDSNIPWIYIYGSAEDHDAWTSLTSDSSVISNLNSLSSSGVSNDVIDLGEFMIIGLNNSSNPEVSFEVKDVQSKISSSKKPVILATHVPIESKLSSLAGYSKSIQNNRIYYWADDSYKWILSNNTDMNSLVQDSLYKVSSVKAVLAGHMHHKAWSGELVKGITQHIFPATYKGYIGVINIR